MDSINVVLAKFRIAPVEIEWNIALPIGISFYTLTALGYLIDVYRGKSEAEHNFLRYALFVSFFPQILSGPIERSTNLLRQLRDSSIKRNWNTERIVSGFITMLWGFFLKLVIADRIAVIADTTFGSPECYGTFGLVFGAVSYGIQIYCDFSSYSLIALGAAKTLGFDLINNFETPYFAQSVTEFWRRWHISLSTWLRDYVYISMGGNRCSKWRQYWNILVTFMVSGLWHGANWTFLVWGALHGIYQILEKELRPIIRKINGYCHTKTASFGYRFAKAIATFALVDFAWIFFRADSVRQALYYIKRMFRYVDGWSLFDGSLYTFGLDVQEIHILLIGLACLFIVDLVQYLKRKKIAEALQEQWIIFRWCVLICLVIGCIVFGYYGQGFESAQFIYLQF
ncbi:MBOAT family O-acyltransferase [Gallintestinimicrobium sp.]|uniref:MBOAT family O-acyltransferase n=1 Tax=Gallintestinimicrobium sp. TaxID=2981655 RepID=UPI003995AD5B